MSFRPKGEIFLRSLAFARDDGPWPVTLRSWRLGAIKRIMVFGFKRESRAGCQELVNGLVKFLWLLRHRKVTGLVQLQILRAGYGPMDLHFILRR